MRRKSGCAEPSLRAGHAGSVAGYADDKEEILPGPIDSLSTCRTPPRWYSNWPTPTMTARFHRKKRSMRATCWSGDSSSGQTPTATVS